MLQPKQTPKEKKNTKDAMKMKNMRPTGPTSGRVKPTMGSAKSGKSISKADILKGRGVIAKKGMSIKKAQEGTVEYSDPKPLFDKIKKSKDSINKARLNLKDEKNTYEKKYKSNISKLKTKSKAKTGTTMKKCRYGCN